ncbi:LysR substrate-binding domain-containing protein [Variovorax sp. YR216]|uniref:LysR substrate-binding domain-containing protein n=1 Tax=Variovorax sp. YR216 TaxID=1882828 RepID=UPI00089B9990|nr:LysR substrate-binding domain-containing protein [Variovorax sp. YR216]SEB26469.1 transcriptional regulator, LysR family [Variovorax sp. YR216]
MDLRQLNYFAAVAESKHLGRAAERLHLSQPPLTRQIQSLESELGVQLFKRTPRGMEVTSAGQELLQHALSIRALVEQAAERTRRAGRGEAGRLDVGVYGSAMFGIVPKVLAAFSTAHPEVQVVLHHAQTPVQLPALRQKRVQLVFERLLPEEPDVQVERVCSEPVLVALSADHRLAKDKRIDVAQLRDETVLIGSSPSGAAQAVELCRAHGFEPRIAPPLTDVVTATLLAATGTGVTFVPGSMTNVQFPGIAYRPIKTRIRATMDLHCFYLRGDGSPLLASMLKTIRSLRRELAATAR